MPGRIDMRAIFLNVLERRAALSAWPTRSGDAPGPLCSALVVSGVARGGLCRAPLSHVVLLVFTPRCSFGVVDTAQGMRRGHF